MDRGDGWAVLDDGAQGAFEPAKADCSQMVITANDDPSVCWSFRVGSETIRTAYVPLRELSCRPESPLGAPLKNIA